MIEKAVDRYAWLRVAEIIGSEDFAQALADKVIEAIEHHIWPKIEEAIDSEEFVGAVADRAANYTEMIALKVQRGDVLIVPETTDMNQIETLYRVFDGTGIVGIIAGNIDEISLLRTRETEDGQDKYLHD
jgi:hypothetical protein